MLALLGTFVHFSTTVQGQQLQHLQTRARCKYCIAINMHCYLYAIYRRRSSRRTTLKEMSVGLCRGNGMMLAAGRKVLVHVTGTDVQQGLPRPTTELL